MNPVSFVGMLYTSPRVGQNALLGALRAVIPGADELGRAAAPDGRLVFTMNRPIDPELLWEGWDITTAEFGDPIWISRRDKVSQSISWALAAQTGQFRSDTRRLRSPVYSEAAVTLGVNALIDTDRIIEEQLVGRRHLRLWFEDDIEADPTAAAQQVLDWWGIEGQAGPTDVKRLDDGVKADWLDRYLHRSVAPCETMDA